MALTSTHAPAQKASQVQDVKFILMSAVQIHAIMEEYAMTRLALIVVTAVQDTPVQTVSTLSTDVK
jgi:hypothetical protein